MQNQSMKMYEILNDPKELSKYKFIDIYTKRHGSYKILKNCYTQRHQAKTKFTYLNKRLYITLEDRIKLIREKQFQLNSQLKNSMKVDIVKAKKILKNLIFVTLSEPRSKLLLDLNNTIKIIIDDYLKNRDIVSYLTRICVHNYSTQLHLINVMLYCMGYAYYNKMDKEDIKLYGLIGLMHDVGMINVSGYLLKASRKMTEYEFDIIKRHPWASWRMLKQSHFDHRIQITAQEHHERLDGSGYPNGKTSKELCEESRVLAIIDIFEALTSWRPYKNSINPFKALQVISNDVKENKLDARIFKKFAYSIVGMSSPSLN